MVQHAVGAPPAPAAGAPAGPAAGAAAPAPTQPAWVPTFETKRTQDYAEIYSCFAQSHWGGVQRWHAAQLEAANVYGPRDQAWVLSPEREDVPDDLGVLSLRLPGRPEGSGPHCATEARPPGVHQGGYQARSEEARNCTRLETVGPTQWLYKPTIRAAPSGKRLSLRKPRSLARSPLQT